MSDTVTVPVHCLHCGKPVTVEYRPYLVRCDTLETDNKYPCPHCWGTLEVRLPGTLIDAWSGHRPDPFAS